MHYLDGVTLPDRASFAPRLRARARKVALGGRLALAAVSGRRTPLFVGWALTDTRNLSCSYCGRWDRGSPELPGDRMLALCDEMATAQVARVSLTGGEPLVHPQCLDIAERLAGHGIAVSLNSNGLLVPRHLDRLAPVLTAATVSVDGGRDAHDAQRGEGSWDKAIEGARALLGAGVDVALHAVVTGRSADDGPELLDVARRLGIKVGFSVVEPVPAMGRRDLDPWTPSPERWRAFVDDLIARREAGEDTIQNSTAGLRYLRNWPEYAPIKCSAGVVYARIEPDGRMYGCGNLVREGASEDLAALPFGKAFDRLVAGTCEACWCDTRVEMNLLLAGNPSALAAGWAR